MLTRLDPNKLYVEFRPGVTLTEPVIGRRYTLTHSDITADLFLTIGLLFAYDKITAMRDEVLAEWRTDDGNPFLYVSVFVDGQFGPGVAGVRNAVFRREMPLALEAIRYGDRVFFETHPELDSAPIWIHFSSSILEKNQFENWGTPGDYK